MKRTIFLILITLAVALPLFAGGTQESSPSSVPPTGRSPFPLTVTDARDKTITLKTEPVRIVSLGPNMTELIYALGRGDLLAGRTDWCDFPAAAAQVPSVGSLREPSVETILTLRPDLVIASTHAPLENLDLLEDAGIPTAVFYGPDSYTGVYQVIEATGEVLGADAEAADLLEEMKSRTEAVLSAVATLTAKPRVYYVVGFGEGGIGPPRGTPSFIRC